MTRWHRWLMAVVLGAAMLAAAAQDADEAPAPAAEQPALDAEQEAAVGIEVAHPLAARPIQSIPAWGQVLDPAALVADAGQLDVARAAERSAAADLARLQGLYRGEAGASLKMLQAATAEQARAQAQADSAAATLAVHWGPLAALPPTQRRDLIGAVAAGQRLLVRADLLGRHSIGELAPAASLDVDGVRVPAHVLGVLSASTDVQGAGVLLQVDAAPRGFGPGARVPVTLQGGVRSGVLVPASALVYGERGAQVYRQLVAKSAEGKRQYAAVAVTLLQRQGERWLVGGLDDDDLVVVKGAGVLWSLQGLGAAAEDDDD